MYTKLPIDNLLVKDLHKAILENTKKRIMRTSNIPGYNGNYPVNISTTATVMSKIPTAYEVIKADIDGLFDNYAEVRQNLHDYKELDYSYQAYKNCAITLKELYPGDKMAELIRADCVDFERRLSALRMDRLEIIGRLMMN